MSRRGPTLTASRSPSGRPRRAAPPTVGAAMRSSRCAGRRRRLVDRRRTTLPGPDGQDALDYGYLDRRPARTLPGPAVAAPAGAASTSARAPTTRPRSPGPTRPGPAAAGRLGDLRAARRHLHPRRHPRRRDREARPPALDRRRPRRADAGQRLQRHPQLGVRRGRLVRGHRGVRRPAGVPALRRRLPRRRARRRRRTSSTTTSARPGTTCRCSGPTSRTGRNTWGDLVNLDGEGSAEVRRFILDNVHDVVRGLPRRRAAARRRARAGRHARRCTSSRRWRSRPPPLSAHLGRPLTLIAESDLNDPTLVTPREGGGYGLDAQWSDDFHHAAARGADRRDRPATTPTSSRCRRWPRSASAGSSTTARGRRSAGATTAYPSTPAHLPTWRLVVCSQNHDQIGNRARGDRLTEHLDDDQLACAALLTLCGPFTPMLFMGEEWAASTPFQFFTSHPEPELGEATAEGRITEFERMGWDPSVVPDPQDPATFERSKLDWSELAAGRHARPAGRLPPARRAAPAAAGADRPGVPLAHRDGGRARRGCSRCGAESCCSR